MSRELTNYDRVWLQEAARRIREGLPIDEREMMVKLRHSLPRRFEPSHIDRAFVRRSGPTLLGLRKLGDSADLLGEVDLAIRKIRDAIIEDTSMGSISAEALGRSLEIPEGRAGRLLYLISTLGRFSAGGTGGEDGRYVSLLLDRDDVVAEYLAFESLDQVLDSEPDITSSGRPVSAPLQPEAGEAGSDVFVIMSMNPEDPSLDDVLNGIRDVCSEFDLQAKRIDEEEHSDKITDRIIERIRDSSLIVADLSGERPNVYYEVGFAHALDKRPILYRRAGTPLHFDLRVHNVPEYRNVTEFKEMLRRRLEAVLGRSSSSEVS